MANQLKEKKPLVPSVVVNFFGGACTGKSTISFQLVGFLKLIGASVEMAPEYIKSWTFRDQFPDQKEQIAILGKQSSYESQFYNKIKIIVSESPLWLVPFYQQHYSSHNYLSATVSAMVKEAEEHKISFLNFWLERPIGWEQDGRYGTREEAVVVDQKMHSYLTGQGLNLINLPVNPALRLRLVVEQLKKHGSLEQLRSIGPIDFSLPLDIIEGVT